MIRTLTSCLLLAGLAAHGARATNGAIEVWVEPQLTDCDSTTVRPISPESWGQSGLGGDGLDADGNFGTAENSDTMPATDTIFGSIGSAVGSVSAGGTIHVPARGVYRDTNTTSITQSVTIHGFSDSDVILSGDDCFNGAMTMSTATALTISLGSGETVVLENLDFRRFDTAAIDLTLSSGGTLIVRNCSFRDNLTAITVSMGSGDALIIQDSRFYGQTTAIDLGTSSGGDVVLDGCHVEGNTTGLDLLTTTGGSILVQDTGFLDNTQSIEDDGGGPELRVVGSSFTDGSYGIRGANGLSVTNSTFSGQGTNAIEGTVAKDWRIASSRISGCGGVSIAANGSGTGTHTLAVSDTRIDSGGDSGIVVDGATVTLTVHGSSSIGNAGDGVHVEAQVGSVITITDSNLEQNDDDGLFVQNTMGCTDPSNLVSVGVMDSRLSANGDDGIDIGGTGTGCSGNVAGPVECGIVKNTIVGNGDFGIVETTSSSTFHCGVGVNMLSFNVSGAESGTGGVCTAGAVALNQVN